MQLMDTGAALITQERLHQLAVGFTPEHDAEHTNGQLVRAALSYIDAADIDPAYRDVPPLDWPWRHDSWRPEDDLHCLVKAGALVAAEIDRRLTAGETEEADRRA